MLEFYFSFPLFDSGLDSRFLNSFKDGDNSTRQLMTGGPENSLVLTLEHAERISR